MKNNIRTAWFLAQRMLLRGRKGLTFLPVLVTGIIYVNLLFVPALIHGAIQQNQEKIINTLSSDLVISPPVNESDLNEKARLLEEVRKLSSVHAATAVYQVGNRIQNGERGGYWTVLAVDTASFQQVFKNEVASGSFLYENDKNAIVLGDRIAGTGLPEQSDTAASLGGVGVGKPVKVLLYNVGEHEFISSGIINNKFYDADTRAYINDNYYETLNPESKDKATAIHIKVKPGVDVSEVRKQLSVIIGNARLQDSEQLGANVREQAGTLRSINDIVTGMAVGVAAATIFIVIYIDILQRRKQIGTQRAIGITSDTIIFSYIIKAMLYTLFGIILGGLIFMLFLVPYFRAFPFTFLTGEVSLVPELDLLVACAAILLVTALLASWLPAYKVTRSEIRETMSE